MEVAQELTNAATEPKPLGTWGVEPEYHLVHLHRENGVGLPMDWTLSARAQGIADAQLTSDEGAKGCGGASDSLEAVSDAVSWPRSSIPAWSGGLACDPAASKVSIFPER